MIPVSATNSDSTNWNTVNGIARDVANSKVTQIFNDDTGTQRVLLGKGKDGFYGLKVSQTGVDVYDATNDQLVFNSDQNVFKIVYTGTVTVPDPGAGSYTQSFVEVNTGIASATATASTAYMVSSGYSYPLPFYTPALNGNYGGFLWTFQHSTRLSGGTVRFRVDCSNFDVVSGPGSVTVKYYILQESAT